MDVREVDTADEALLHALWQVGWDGQGDDRPWHLYGPWPSVQVRWQRRSANYDRHLLAAYDGDRPVGFAEMSLPLRDNLHLVELEVQVHPEARRRGHGTALWAAVRRIGRDAGRTSAWTMAIDPVAGGGPGVAFARHHGWTEAISDEIKVADLGATADRWPRMVAETEESARGYELVTWADRCPDELVVPYCEVSSRFLALAPMGELDVEPEVWDEARLRDREEAAAQSGRAETITMALAPDGSGAGFTELMTSVHRPERVVQGATVVLPEHRGHALGLRLKAVNHLASALAHPAARFAVTGNAAVNTHMNAINEALGFEVVEHSVEFQRAL